MRPTGMRHWNALLLLALMAFFSAPSAWFHECDEAGLHTRSTNGAVVHEDDHCPICELVQAPQLAEVTVLVVLRADMALDLSFRFSSNATMDRSAQCASRGPPSLA